MNAYLFPALETTPGLLKRQFDRIPGGSIDSPTHPDRFTPREVIAHLADWEPILLARMKQTVDSPGSTIEPFDEGTMAVENGYASSDPQERFQHFVNSRKETIDWLKNLPKEHWQRSANHPERGEVSVNDWANMVACHDVYHIEQLSAL